ncbi:unnamed protein product [Lactuca saligna]|uniref:Uncharacterized protein n=1 Tax=Lactuca saligna TaxID=75948 RepID=A0AA35ZQJ2_LACSI|nr:unnamed protein product [Lactuca saligna]
MLETRGGNKVNRCAFISPSEIQATICESNGEGVLSYIADAMRFHKDKRFFVAPYWQGVVARLKEDIDTTHPMKWTLVECNQQPSSWECNFYVMRWMFEFVLTRQNEFPNKNNWNDKKPFMNLVLNEIIIMWSSRFESEYLSQVPL